MAAHDVDRTSSQALTFVEFISSHGVPLLGRCAHTVANLLVRILRRNEGLVIPVFLTLLDLTIEVEAFLFGDRAARLDLALHEHVVRANDGEPVAGLNGRSGDFVLERRIEELRGKASGDDADEDDPLVEVAE